MKKIRFTIIAMLFVSLWSCNENKWLNEEPLSFYAPENSYQTTVQFRQALNFLYDNLRAFYWKLGDETTALQMGDIANGGTDYPDLKFNNFKAFITPTTNTPRKFWDEAYNSIANANIILNRLTLENHVSDADKAIIRGEALLFRAYYYNFLGNLYGGVPIILEEVSTPKRDYVRATRDEVYQQAQTDLEEAVSLLPNIEKVKDGVVSKQVAQHLLTEVYISREKYTDAINTATAVISYPEMSLMTTRFGSRADKPGNPYWDLFQLDNQNRSSGNKESLLVLQYEYQSAGSTYGCMYPRYMLPFYPGANVEGKDGGLVPAFTNITAEKGGRGIGVIRPTNYFLNGLWGEDFDNDFRNSSQMIVRDFKIDNPSAKGYDQWMMKDGWARAADTLRQFYPFVMKFSRVGYVPDDVFAKNADGTVQQTALGEHVIVYGGWNGEQANVSYKDEYIFRLAETYLLRAEAYLDNNEPGKAADDINALRERANASLVTASDINIDFILDERMRELYFEDYRVVTLCRLGKMVERTRKYNPTGYNIGDYQNLFPIPYGEIEKNTGAVIEQNPGYQ